MTSTPQPSSVNHRASKVFVQVPPSPYNLSQYHPLKSTPAHVPTISSRLKENTPFRPLHSAMLQSGFPHTSSLKRKSSDHDSTSTALDSKPSSSKKIKPSTTGSPFKLSQINSPPAQVAPPTANACPDFPNGFIYCHQCAKKRDVAVTIHCTVVKIRHTTKGKTPAGQRCTQKFCQPCLKNRYGEDLAILKTVKKRETGHVVNAGYIFECPKCRDMCNCHRCRKAKGLDPLGTMAHKGAEAATVNKKEEKSIKKVNSGGASQIKPLKSIKSTKAVKAKALLSVKWTRLAPHLTKSEVEERICIREFVLRFAGMRESSIPKNTIEELEQINGRRSGHDDYDPTAWVSESCVKSIISALLGLLARDAAPRFEKVVNVAMKNLRTAGVNLNKLWSILVDLRDAASSHDSKDASSDPTNQTISLAIADPRPPPAHLRAQTRRSTRGMVTSTSNSFLSINSSAQMIPTILSLIDLVLETHGARQEIDEGMKEGRETTRRVREAIRMENERWDNEKKLLEGKGSPMKERKHLHNKVVRSLDSALQIALHSTTLRFSPMGVDHDGRMYYALSPGLAEREAALEYFDAMSNAEEPVGQLRKRGRVLNKDERDELKDWSWLIAVWGKRPPSARLVEFDDTDEDAWWAFAHPKDIKELAEWIAIDNGLEDETAPVSTQTPTSSAVQAPLKQLVTALKDFSSSLEWRSQDDKYQLANTLDSLKTDTSNISNTSGMEKGKGPSVKSIPAAQFYG